MLLTIPKAYKKREHINELREIHIKKEIAIIGNIVKHHHQFNPKMPYRVLCECNKVEFELVFFNAFSFFTQKTIKTYISGAFFAQKYTIFVRENHSERLANQKNSACGELFYATSY